MKLLNVSSSYLKSKKKKYLLAILRSLMPSMSMVAIAALSMGNQSCDQNKASDEGRVLKMDVLMNPLRAKAVTLPNGEIVDFPYIANSLFLERVMMNDHFVSVGRIPEPTVTTDQNHAMASVGAKANDPMASKKDLEVLERYGFLTTVTAHPEKQTTQKGTVAETSLPTCLYQSPQSYLAGDIYSFESSGGGGIRIGFGQNGSTTTVSGNVGVKLSNMKLDMSLRTDDPLSGDPVVIAPHKETQRNIDLSLNLGSAVPIGFDFFFHPTIADTIRAAIDASLDATVEQYKKMKSTKNVWNEVWESRVVYDPKIADNDTNIAFRGGYRSGIKEGDQFFIRNMQYHFEGKECASRLSYRIPTSQVPIAVAEVITVGDNISVAKVKYFTEEAIKPGAQVQVYQLKVETPKK